MAGKVAKGIKSKRVVEPPVAEAPPFERRRREEPAEVADRGEVRAVTKQQLKVAAAGHLTELIIPSPSPPPPAVPSYILFFCYIKKRLLS